MGSSLPLPSLRGEIQCFCKNEMRIFHCARGGFEKVVKSRECFNRCWRRAHQTLRQRPVNVSGTVLALYFTRVEHRTLARPDWHVRSPYGVEQTQTTRCWMNNIHCTVVMTWLCVCGTKGGSGVGLCLVTRHRTCSVMVFTFWNLSE